MNTCVLGCDQLCFHSLLGLLGKEKVELIPPDLLVADKASRVGKHQGK